MDAVGTLNPDIWIILVWIDGFTLFVHDPLAVKSSTVFRSFKNLDPFSPAFPTDQRSSTLRLRGNFKLAHAAPHFFPNDQFARLRDLEGQASDFIQVRVG